MSDYVVMTGESFYSIARLFGVTTEYLRQLNPEIENIDHVMAGQILRVPNTNHFRRLIEMNGYCYPDIDEPLSLTLLPYLTFLSILSYQINLNGSLTNIADIPLIQASLAARVAPFMVVTNMVAGQGFSAELAHAILADIQLQQKILINIASVLRFKNYYGINLDFEYIYPSDISAYFRFLQLIMTTLQPLGFAVIVTIDVELLLNQQIAINEALLNPDFGFFVDRVIMGASNFVCGYDALEVTSTIDQIQRALDYLSTIITSTKILLGIPNCCFEWGVHDLDSMYVRPISPIEAEELFMRTGSQLQYGTQISYFKYTDSLGLDHLAWCGNESAARLPLTLIEIYNLAGASIRTINNFSPASYQALTTMFEIRKVIEV